MALSLKPAARGQNPTDEERRRGSITLPATTEREYDLRSRGPVTFGPEVLDRRCVIPPGVGDVGGDAE